MPKVVNEEMERANILDAFEKCALEVPFNKITVRDIGKKAGISHSKIFSYFDSKNEIITSYANRVAELYAKSFEEFVEKNLDLIGTKSRFVEKIVEELFEIDPDNKFEKIYIQIYVLGQYDPEIRKLVLRAYKSWRDALKKSLHKLTDVGDREVCSLLVLIEGIMIYRMNDDLSKEDASHIVHDLL
ncbi:MAG: TetR/AcrR family transcriptional regulator [Eubacteriales bacterium]|nr:TetR/AcrR family transcriptional regulator [Eubacteriales bacterium]